MKFAKIAFPKRLSDKELFPSLDRFRRLAESPGLQIFFDMSKVEWGDAFSLLMLAVTLRTFLSPGTALTFDLGYVKKSSSEHRVFLKFFADQGFLETYQTFSTIVWDGISTDKTPVLTIKEDLISFSKPTNLSGVDCIHARLVCTPEFGNSQTKLELYVDELIREARIRVRDAAFDSSPFVKDRIFQKLRKLLFELVLNVAEHAYPDNSGYVGIYVRVRSRRPALGEDAVKWDELSGQERQNAVVLEGLEVDINSDWLEVLICDAGCGLVSNLESWAVSREATEVKAAIMRAASSKDKLFSLAPSLFKLPFSRFERDSSDRPAITGLQFLGHVLGLDGDYCRIHTADQWLGGRHPWEESVGGSRMRTDSFGRRPAPGTAFAIVLQPKDQRTTYPEDTWITPDEFARWRIVDALQENAAVDSRITVVDRREQESQIPPLPMEHPDIETRDIIVFRPRRHLPKNIASRWVDAAFDADRLSVSWKASTLIFAELTPSQAVILVEAIKRFRLRSKKKCDIYLISEEWVVTCLSGNSQGRLEVDIAKARTFLESPKNYRGPTAAKVALSLRVADSNYFWSTNHAGSAKDFFLVGVIEWEAGVRLRSFVDLPKALSDPLRYRASRRALRRLLQLFPDRTPEATDDTIRSLISDSFERSYSAVVESDATTKLPVGSVCVTLSTIAKYQERYKLGKGAISLSLLNHESMRIRRPSKAPLAALLWSPPITESVPQVYVRIPDTPFITLKGDKAISIVRFRSDVARRSFASPFYPRTPSQTYDDFLRYRALKLGHWNYRGRHDLLTINFTQIIDLSILENGPLLAWLYSEFETLFLKGAQAGLPAVLLIYPSHQITDRLVQFIRTERRFLEIFSRVPIIPISFIGSHSVSPLQMPPLTLRQIRESIANTGRVAPATVILDDAAVSGKHLRELAQILREAGSGQVHTVTLLDRTGLPIREGVMDEFLRRHRRYWRWDVPTIGHGRDCIMCASVRRIRAMADQPLLPHLKRRLREWESDWAVIEVSEGWHSSGLNPAGLNDTISITFGIDQRGETQFRNSVEHKISTSLAAMTVELTRLTTKAETALSKAEQIVGSSSLDTDAANIQTAIEIIASQLIIFFDELSYWQKLDRYWFLLKLVWGRFPESRITSLIGLCFALVPDEVAETLWERTQNELISRAFLKNHDAILCAKFITPRYATPPKVDRSTNDVANWNLMLLSDAENYKTTIVALFSTIGFRSSESHQRPLLDRLAVLSRQTDVSTSELRGVRGEVNQLLESLESSLERLSHVPMASPELGSAFDVMSDLERLRQYIERGRLPQASSEQRVWAEDVKLWLFGVAADEGVSKRYQRHFFHSIRKGALQAGLLGQIISSVQESWESIKIGRLVGANSSLWRNQRGERLKPLIKCGIADEWKIDCDVCFDPLIREAIRDAFANVIHTNAVIYNPWDENEMTSAHMWWRAQVRDGYLEVEIVNATHDARIILKPTPAIQGLARIGGDLIAECDSAKHRITTTITIPLADTLVRDL